jgi:acyl-CoA reductase-like NAD-dependent aldehyde dehydrogenase
MSKNFIGGKWREAVSGRRAWTRHEPRLRPIADSGAEDVDLAVRAARPSTKRMGRTTAVDRGRMLSRLGGPIRNTPRSAGHRIRDTGNRRAWRMPISSRSRGIRVLRRRGRQVAWRDDSLLERVSVALLREPHGVTGHILRGTIPRRCSAARGAVACGWERVVLKPAEDASDSSRLAGSSQAAEGAVNIVRDRTCSRRGARITQRGGLHLLHRLAYRRSTGQAHGGSLHPGAGARRQVSASCSRMLTSAPRPDHLPRNHQNTGQTCSAAAC